MTENSTPRSGESVSDASVDYEKLAQALLSRELERRACDFHEIFMASSRAVGRGEDLDAATLRELEQQITQAEFLVEELREAME